MISFGPGPGGTGALARARARTRTRRVARGGARYRAYTAWKRARPLVLAPAFLAALRDDALRGGPRGAACRLCRLVANGTAGRRR